MKKNELDRLSQLSSKDYHSLTKEEVLELTDLGAKMAKHRELNYEEFPEYPIVPKHVEEINSYMYM